MPLLNHLALTSNQKKKKKKKERKIKNNKIKTSNSVLVVEDGAK